MPTSNSLTILNNIRIIEYCSFKGKSEIEDGLQSFNNDIAARLDNFLIDCRVLDIAIHEDLNKQGIIQGENNPIPLKEIVYTISFFSIRLCRILFLELCGNL